MNIGKRISRKQAIDIARKIMEEAEAARLKAAEEDARRYFDSEEVADVSSN